MQLSSTFCSFGLPLLFSEKLSFRSSKRKRGLRQRRRSACSELIWISRSWLSLASRCPQRELRPVARSSRARCAQTSGSSEDNAAWLRAPVGPRLSKQMSSKRRCLLQLRVTHGLLERVWRSCCRARKAFVRGASVTATEASRRQLSPVARS